ncbi:MAG: methyltransferase domain-containing protein [Bacteroidota bacterium]
MAEINGAFWEKNWARGRTPWDMGQASPALVAYVEQLADKNRRILVPGAGSGHEAAWFLAHGYPNVHFLDIAPTAIATVRANVPDYPAAQLIEGDFFAHTGTYDLILEQTFFCALPPALRPDYAQKMHELLVPGGTLAGLLFDFPLAGGPPFGGNAEEYRGYFAPYFTIKTMERAYNSIKPRAGAELFFILRK